MKEQSLAKTILPAATFSLNLHCILRSRNFIKPLKRRAVPP